MKTIQYAKAKITHGDFRKNNLYEVAETINDESGKVRILHLKVKGNIVSVKLNNFEIVSCVFNEEKAE